MEEQHNQGTPLHLNKTAIIQQKDAKKNSISIFGLILALCFIVLFVGCKQTDKEVPARVILKQMNAQMHSKATDQLYVQLPVGTFELNDSTGRHCLRQLQEAGLIKYGVKRYVWWEKSKKTERRAFQVTRGLYWTWTETEYRNVVVDNYTLQDHYVVNVELTAAGKQLVLKKTPEAEPIVDIDMIQPYVDASQYSWNKKNLSEKWPVIPNPFISTTAKEKILKTNSATRNSAEKTSVSPQKTPKITRIDSLQYQDFSKICLGHQTVTLNAGIKKAVKARNIQRIVPLGVVTAKAEVIVETMKVTDVGRILLDLENGQKELKVVNLIFYQDKGWVISESSEK